MRSKRTGTPHITLESVVRWELLLRAIGFAVGMWGASFRLLRLVPLFSLLPAFSTRCLGVHTCLTLCNHLLVAGVLVRCVVQLGCGDGEYTVRGHGRGDALGVCLSWQSKYSTETESRCWGSFLLGSLTLHHDLLPFHHSHLHLTTNKVMYVQDDLRKAFTEVTNVW